MREEKKRLFIALECPDDVQQVLAEVASVLAGQMPRGAVRWVRPEQMHLTLFFLGDTAVSQIMAVQQVMDNAAAQCVPFLLTLSGVGAFPNKHQPRVIWVGLTGTDGAMSQLAQLQAGIAGGVAALGWPQEKRPFRPHLTLGRVKDRRQLQGENWGTEVKRVVWPVTAVTLIQSTLTPHGPIYKNLHHSSIHKSQK
ncbi:MAG: RNA 2',3'-cyclic phosphodiesterase [Candidatus Promineifilaceae bacterium]